MQVGPNPTSMLAAQTQTTRPQPAVSSPPPQPQPAQPSLNAGNMAQQSRSALAKATVAESGFGMFKAMCQQMAKTTLTPAVQPVRTESAPAVPRSPAAVKVSAAEFAKKSQEYGREVANLSRELTSLTDGDGMSFDWELDATASAGLNAFDMLGAKVQASGKSATSVEIDQVDGLFYVSMTLSDTKGAGGSIKAGPLGEEALVSRGDNAKTFLYACKSAQAAASLVVAFHKFGNLDIPDTVPLVADTGGKVESTTVTKQVLVTAAEKSTAYEKVLGLPSRLMDSVVPQTVESARRTFQGDGFAGTIEKFALGTSKSRGAGWSIAKAVTSAVSAVTSKAFGVSGQLNASRTATKAELKLMRATESGSGNKAVTGGMTLQIDADKVKALRKNPQAMEVLTRKLSGKLTDLMKAANDSQPGTFDINPQAVQRLVRDTLSAVEALGKPIVEGMDARTTGGELGVGGDLGLVELKAKGSVEFKHGEILTLKFPLAQADDSGKLAFQDDQVEIGITQTSGQKFGGGLEASVGLTGKLQAQGEVGVGAADARSAYHKLAVVGDVPRPSLLNLPVLDQGLAEPPKLDADMAAALEALLGPDAAPDIDALLGSTPNQATADDLDDLLLGPAPARQQASDDLDDLLLGPTSPRSDDLDDFLVTANPLPSQQPVFDDSLL